MTPIMLLLLTIVSDGPLIIASEQIQFRTMESCQIAAAQLERDLSGFNARAICIDRNARP